MAAMMVSDNSFTCWKQAHLFSLNNSERAFRVAAPLYAGRPIVLPVIGCFKSGAVWKEGQTEAVPVLTRSLSHLSSAHSDCFIQNCNQAAGNGGEALFLFLFFFLFLCLQPEYTDAVVQWDIRLRRSNCLRWATAFYLAKRFASFAGRSPKQTPWKTLNVLSPNLCVISLKSAGIIT